MRENDVTQSNIKETKTDIIKHVMMAAICIMLFPPSELLQNKTQFFSIAYIAVLCQNIKFEQCVFSNPRMCPKDSGRIANSAEHDPTLSSVWSVFAQWNK